MTEEILEVKNFSYKYPLHPEYALENISFSLKKGDFCLILGKSGCGKSTLCLSLNGIIPHMLGGNSSGSIIIKGKEVAQTEVRDLSKIVTMVFQDPNRQLCNIEVENEVAFSLENLLFEPEEIKKRVDEALKFVGLEDYKQKTVWNLSGGEKQRLAIASALALKPEILILDEPTSNLDPKGITETFETIQKIRRETNCTIILVEHHLDELIDEVDKTLVIDKGSVIFDGSLRQLLNNNGELLLKDLGLWLPQYSIIGLKARAIKLDIPQIPMTMEEATRVFKNFVSPTLIKGKNQNISEPILKVQNLQFNYPDGTEVLKQVNLQINKGDMLAILGKNGSGKSTLAYHFVGILKPSSGKVIVEGLNTTETTMAQLVKKVAYVFQVPEHQFIENTVFKEVSYSLQGLSHEEKERKTKKMLTSLNLLKEGNRHPTTLSMGQMRRLSVGSMLITEPDIIILDEPTYGQDRKSARTLMNYMKKLNNVGKTIIFITHNMKLAAEYAKRAVVLNDGRVSFDGTPEELFNDEKVLEECNLVPPPIFRLSQQFGNNTILTEDEFISNLKR